VFTLSSGKALEKLSGFQLPFRGAWAVKVIQALVAAPTQQSIHVTQGRRNTKFQFEVDGVWDYVAFEQQFQNPELGPRQDMNHLAMGLWAVGLGQERPFDLILRGQDDFVRWDGKKLFRGVMADPAMNSYLKVSHWGASRAPSLLDLGDPTARKANADVSFALSRRCFTSPVPLYLDHRRLDALQFCPFHGWGEEQVSLRLGFASGDLPHLRLPTGTFEYLDSDERDKSVVLRPAVDRVEDEFRRSADVAYQVSYHTRVVESSAQGRDTVITFSDIPSKCRCHWVLDGAVIKVGEYAVEPLPCSVGVYLSAQGLATDLTTFNLQDSSERERRKAEALERVTEMLVQSEDFRFSDFASRSKKTAAFRVGSLLLSVAGLCSLPFLTAATSIYGVATIVFGWAGYCTSVNKVKPKDQWALKERMESDYRLLKERLKERE
jgi:hypothetical protein